MIEDALSVNIARAAPVMTGEPDSAALARDVYSPLQSLDQAMTSTAPPSNSIIAWPRSHRRRHLSKEVAQPTLVIIRPQEDHRPAPPLHTVLYGRINRDDMVSIGPGRHRKTYLAVAQYVAIAITSQVDRLISPPPFGPASASASAGD